MSQSTTNESRSSTKDDLDEIFTQLADKLDDIPSESQAEDKPPKKKKTPVWRYPTKSEVIVLFNNCVMSDIDGLVAEANSDVWRNLSPGCEARVVDSQLIRIYPTKQERRQRDNIYRRELAKKGGVTATSKQKKEITKDQREQMQKYNSDPDVIHQKQLRQNARRQLLKEKKEKDPSKFNNKIVTLMKKIDPSWNPVNKRKAKKQLEKKETKKQKTGDGKPTSLERSESRIDLTQSTAS